MKRYLAKISIQYFYDSHPSTSQSSDSNTDPLPQWLRKWINNDSRLKEYELELRCLEQRLVSQANRFAERRYESAEFASTERSDLSRLVQSASSDSMPTRSIAFVALAAGLACLLLAAGWSAWNSNAGSRSTKSIAQQHETHHESSPEELRPSADPLRPEQLARSSWEATKRLAMRMKVRSGQANNSISLVDKQAFETPLREVGGELLRFVAQKIPQATVRMLGMSAAHDRF